MQIQKQNLQFLFESLRDQKGSHNLLYIDEYNLEFGVYLALYILYIMIYLSYLDYFVHNH